MNNVELLAARWLHEAELLEVDAVKCEDEPAKSLQLKMEAQDKRIASAQLESAILMDQLKVLGKSA